MQPGRSCPILPFSLSLDASLVEPNPPGIKPLDPYKCPLITSNSPTPTRVLVPLPLGKMAFSSLFLSKGLLVILVVMLGSGVSAGKPLPLSSSVVVEGVVYCKSCAYENVDTLLGATPLPGATVKLECNNTRVPTVVYATTDKNGYFYMEASKSKVTTYAVDKCKLCLSSSSLKNCSKPTNLNGGLSGAPLKFRQLLAGNPPTALYAAGPLAFAPTQCRRAPRTWTPHPRPSTPFSPPPPPPPPPHHH